MRNSSRRLQAPHLNRRQILAGMGVATGASVLAAHQSRPALAQRAKGPEEVPVEELMKSSGLKDLALGPEDAKVTIVEYASLTCGHCARFHRDVFPKIKEKYIDTGKIRFIFREFPLDNLAAAASMLARCVGGDKSYAMVDTLFNKQEEWAFVQGSPVPALFNISKQFGLTKEKFDACLRDEKTLEEITNQRTRASEVFGVNSTPTFFVNGKRFNAGTSFTKFETEIDALLAKT